MVPMAAAKTKMRPQTEAAAARAAIADVAAALLASLLAGGA